MVKAFKKKKKCEKTTQKKKERNVYGHEGVLKIASIGITPWNIECRQFSLGPCPPKVYNQDREGRSVWWHGMEDWTTSDDGEVEEQIYFVVTRVMKLLCEKYFLYSLFFFYILFPCVFPVFTLHMRAYDYICRRDTMLFLGHDAVKW